MRPLDLYTSLALDLNYPKSVGATSARNTHPSDVFTEYIDDTNKNVFNNTSNYTQPKVHDLNYDENKSFELGLGVPDVKFKNSENVVDKTKDIMNYTYSTFKQAKTTEFLNENQNRLWFWKNVGFLFSIGVVLEDGYREVLKSVLKDFDKTQPSFLPNTFKILNYTDDMIKIIEEQYNIGNGNYHFMLVPFVMTHDNEILKQAPEQAYTRYGPVDIFTTPEQVVEYMCEAMYKYGAIKNLLTDTVANALKIPESKDDDRYYKHTDKVINISASHPNQAVPMRMERKGYFDPKTTDNFDLINPVPDEAYYDYSTEKQYFTPGDLKWDNDFKEDSKESNYYRKPVKTVQRTNLTNTGNEYGQNVKRNEGKQGLWFRMYEDKKGMNVPAGFIDIGESQTKGGMLKISLPYESKSQRTDENSKEFIPQYQIYGDTDRMDSKMEKVIPDTHESVFTDTIPQRDNMPVWHQTQIALNLNNINKMNNKYKIKIPAESQGIFSSGYK